MVYPCIVTTMAHPAHEVVDVAVGAEIGQTHPHGLVRDRPAVVLIQGIKLRLP